MVRFLLSGKELRVKFVGFAGRQHPKPSATQAVSFRRRGLLINRKGDQRVTTGKRSTPALVLSLLVILGSLGVCVASALATDISITSPFNFTDNRNPNFPGAIPGYLINVGAVSITPSGSGTTVQAAQGATTINLPFRPSTASPNNYFDFVTFNLSL